MGTKKLIYAVSALNPREKIRFGEYIFSYDSKLNPIPVEVPEDIANILLQMESEVTRCCYKKPKLLFKELA